MIFPLDEYYVIFDRYSQIQGINHIMENIVCYEKVIIPKGCSFLARYDQEATIDTLELHAHDEVEFQFTLSGYGIRTLGEVSEPFKEMEVLLIPGGMPHNWVYQNPEETRIQEYSVQFPKGLVTSQLAAFPEFSNIVSFIQGLESAIEIRGEEASLLSSIMMKMITMQPEDRLIALIQMLSSAQKCPDKRYISPENSSSLQDKNFDKIQKVMAYMEEHMSEDLTLGSVADEFCMGKTAFCNFFKRKTGKSFIFALNEMRINRSCMILTRDTHKSIEQIGYSVGFTSPAHFCRMFRRFRGSSPREYRLRINY